MAPTKNLYIDDGTYEALKDHLFQGESEQVAFLYGRQEEEGGETQFHVEETYPVPEEELDSSSRYFIALSDEALQKAIRKAFDSGLVPIEVHSHRDASYEAGFSRSDFEGFEETVQHVRWRLRGRPYIALVITPTGFDALLWRGDQNGRAEGLDVLIVGDRMRQPSGRSLEKLGPSLNEERYARQLPLFGEEGQRKLRETDVAIVGLGGLGSHVAQQMAYVGVRNFRLIDGDSADPTNLNRLVGATPEDGTQKAPKVEIARRLIHSAAPNANIETYAGYFTTEEGFDLLRSADVIVGTVDNDASRHFLNQFAQAYRIPYMDLASDIDPETGHFGGRLLFSVDGNRCLSCEGLLDQEAISTMLSTEEERAARAEMYGVPEDDLGPGTGPAVISLNGTVASLAVTELLMHITGYRHPNTYLTYDGRAGAYGGVRADESLPEQDCLYCDGMYGEGREAQVEKHCLEEGEGERLESRLETA